MADDIVDDGAEPSEEKTCCDCCCTKTILAKIDKENFINMNYQGENDNSFTTLIGKVDEILKLVNKEDKYGRKSK